MKPNQQSQPGTIQVIRLEGTFGCWPGCVLCRDHEQRREPPGVRRTRRYAPHGCHGNTVRVDPDAEMKIEVLGHGFVKSLASLGESPLASLCLPPRDL